jgi:hypothetical protein
MTPVSDTGRYHTSRLAGIEIDAGTSDRRQARQASWVRRTLPRSGVSSLSDPANSSAHAEGIWNESHKSRLAGSRARHAREVLGVASAPEGSGTSRPLVRSRRPAAQSPGPSPRPTPSQSPRGRVRRGSGDGSVGRRRTRRVALRRSVVGTGSGRNGDPRWPRGRAAITHDRHDPDDRDGRSPRGQ